MIFEVLTNTLHIPVRLSLIPLVVWIAITILAFNPVWRFLWKKFPKLEQWIYPDLNGEWDVSLASNRSRTEQILSAAKSGKMKFDIESCDESELAELLQLKLRATILQTWWKIEIRIWNPENDSPIKQSRSFAAYPIRKKGMLPHRLSYLFEQLNETSKLADDGIFQGAASLEYDINERELIGLFWTARKWDRALNTAGRISYTRR